MHADLFEMEEELKNIISEKKENEAKLKSL